MELSEVFNEVEEVESTPEQAEPEKEVEQVEETTETETVENTENGETTAPHTEDEPKTVPIKALMSEREKVYFAANGFIRRRLLFPSP